MSVYCCDDEMRKQADLLVGVLVVTGQESPETDRPMGKDVCKRHFSADPIACRLPNEVLAKMIQLTGYKRFERHEILLFNGTSETRFESMLWRSLVIVHKARFVSAEDLRISFPDGDSADVGFRQGMSR